MEEENKENDMDVIVGLKDVARFLCMSERWVRKLITEGKFPQPIPHEPQKYVRHRYLRVHLLTWMKENIWRKPYKKIRKHTRTVQS